MLRMKRNGSPSVTDLILTRVSSCFVVEARYVPRTVHVNMHFPFVITCTIAILFPSLTGAPVAFLPANSTDDDDDRTASPDVVRCLEYHKVASGEVPFTIARRYFIRPEQLQFLNPSMDVFNLRSGELLCVSANRYPNEDDPKNENLNDMGMDTTGAPQPTPESDLKLCGDFYALYGMDSDIVLPARCMQPEVRRMAAAATLPSEFDVGFLGRSTYRRDAWFTNCRTRAYRLLCDSDRGTRVLVQHGGTG